MFCNKCGNQLSNDSIFCDKCGARVSGGQTNNTRQAPAYNGPTNAQNSNVNIEDYKNLGGILKYTVIIYKYIGPIMFAISFISTSIIYIRTLHLISQFSYYGSGKAIAKIVFAWLFTTAIMALATILSLKMSKLIERRNADFLKTWQILFIAFIVLVLISGFATGLKSMISTLISLILTFVLWNIYFTKSVRVRVYMGSDEYLRNSLFNKNSPSPLQNNAPVAQSAGYAPVNQPVAPAQPVNPVQPVAPVQPVTPTPQKATEVCPNCGTAVYEGAAFCPICGARYDSTDNQQ